MHEEHRDHEELVRQLNDKTLRDEYARPYNNYTVGMVPKIFGWLLVTSGNILYGSKPAYAKFKAIEVIARIPYQSWESAAYTLLSALYGDERFAIRLCQITAFSRFAQDNETMHVVVNSHITQRHKCEGFFRHTFIPIVFAFFYFWVAYILYLCSHKAALELNYLFESHAYDQYSEFLEKNESYLKQQPLVSEFLQFYGREVRTEYEFFETVRNDELIHRNRSIREITMFEGKGL